MEQGVLDIVIAQAIALNSGLTTIIGIDPMLILTVVIFVSMVDIMFKVRKKWPQYSDIILINVCVVFSVIVSLIAIEDLVSWKQVTRQALVLSGMSTLSYKFIKPVVKRLVQKRLDSLMKKETEENA